MVRFENRITAMNLTDPERKLALLLDYAGDDVHDDFLTLTVPAAGGNVWAAVFTFNPYLLISINELLISIIHLLISINIDTTSIFIDINNSFIDINNSFIDINNSFIDINNSFIDINKDGCCIHLY